MNAQTESHKLTYCSFYQHYGIFACSEIGIQSKKEGTTPASVPDCQKNCTGKGGLITRPIYKTWVKYDHLDLKNGFDLAVKTLQSQGH